MLKKDRNGVAQYIERCKNSIQCLNKGELLVLNRTTLEFEDIASSLDCVVIPFNANADVLKFISALHGKRKKIVPCEKIVEDDLSNVKKWFHGSTIDCYMRLLVSN